MSNEHEKKYQYVHVLKTHHIRISCISSKTWEQLLVQEYRELIAVSKNMQQQYPDHRVLFSQSDEAYIELLPPQHGLASTPVLHTGGRKDPLYPSIRALLKESTHIDIVTAFIQDSGLRILQPLFFDALQRGAHIRILGGDYLHITQGKALQRLLDWKALSSAQEWHGSLEVLIHESQGQSFHPKCWHFSNQKEARAYVGSSNLSFTALCRGVEWNISVAQSQQPLVYERLKHAIDTLCSSSRTLTQSWVDHYIEQAEEHPNAPLPPGEIENEEKDITPLPIQIEALEALKQSRIDGRKRALIVMATGLGKTYVSIFDTQHVQAKRILFLAHRKELLFQAASSFRRLYPKASFGWILSAKKETSADITFASIQTLTRHKELFSTRHFDYIIIDEVHHATATSYRSIIDYFQPSFLLGLTATPDRSDHSDVRALFDDHCAFQASLSVGITRELLVPFHYIGRVDPVDYNRIPWKKDRFDKEVLEKHLCDEPRMMLLLSLWQKHPAEKTLVFCSSIAHADAVGLFLNTHNISTSVLHSHPHSAPREENIDALQKGHISCICTVNLFNEGIDIPSLDRIIMLRPTSSGIVFLQQLGRGLRKHPNKERLTVIDLVGNHHVFLRRLHALSSISQTGGVRTLLRKKSSILPNGCSMDIDVDVIDLLSSLIGHHNNPSHQLFLDYCTIFGHRPHLSSFFRLGGNPKQLYRSSWLSFLNTEKKLNQSESIVFHKYEEWFMMLEHTAMTKSYKMVSLAVLIGAQKLQSGMEIEQFLFTVREYLQRSPLLRYDAHHILQHPEQWKRYFVRWIASSWNQGKKWLLIDKGNIRVPLIIHNALAPTFFELSMEIIRHRLQQYRRRIQAKPLTFDIESSQDDQGLFFLLPSPKDQLPSGKTTVRDHNNVLWSIVFKHPKTRAFSPIHTDNRNIQPQEYFQAKKYRIFFLSDGWHIEPIGEYVVPFVDKVEIPLISTWPNKEGTIWLPKRIPESPLHFAIRAPHELSGLSSVQKGDWLLMRWRNSAPQTAKLVQQETHISLLPATKTTDHNIIAALDAHFSPDELGPSKGTIFPIRDCAIHFGLSEIPPKGFSRIDGQLFLCLSQESTFRSAKELDAQFATHPYETAHTLFLRNENALYLGRAEPSPSGWSIPPLFWETCKSIGLPSSYSTPEEPTHAQLHFDNLPSSGWLHHHGLQARIVKKTAHYYTLSIDKQTYRCSILDVAWALSMTGSNSSFFDLLHHRYVMGYRPKAEERRVLLASWLSALGTHTVQKKRTRPFVDIIRSRFPNQTAHQCILDKPILLYFPSKKIIFLVHSKTTMMNCERWMALHKRRYTTNWNIYFLPANMLHDTKRSIQYIRTKLEHSHALSVSKTS